MRFDYNYTCPIIDKNINNAKGVIKNFIDDLISDLSPMIPAGTREELSISFSENLYSDLEDCFEKVRESNSDIRKAAEKQIENLEYEIQSLKEELQEKENRIYCLQDRYT